MNMMSHELSFNRLLILCRSLITSRALVLTLLLCAGCATTPPPSSTYSGPQLPDEQVAFVDVPDILYSVDDSTRNPAGESYYGRSAHLSLLPGEHTFVIVVPRGYQVGSGHVYAGSEKIWYSVKVTLAAGSKYAARVRFVQQPSLLEYFPGEYKMEVELVIRDLGTGKRVGTGMRVQGTYE